MVHAYSVVTLKQFNIFFLTAVWLSFFGLYLLSFFLCDIPKVYTGYHSIMVSNQK